MNFLSSFFRLFKRAPKQRDESELFDDLRQTSYFFLVFTVVGFFIVSLHSTSLRGATTSSLWAVACLAGGAAIGFLFGIPKILQSDKPDDLADQAALSYRQQVNTNLEQISDWLTKIIVGLGLINLKNIPPNLNRMAEVLTASIGTGNENTAFALALILSFSILGFLFGYLSTRLYLAGAFSRADQYTALIRIKVLANRMNPLLLKQVLSKASVRDIIKGEPSFREERASEPVGESTHEVDEEDEIETGEREQLDQEVAQLNQNT